MSKYENTTIFKVINEVNVKYFLPDIQRPYVWVPEQIYSLYDSIMRGYPINTFLFWEQTAEIIEKLTPRYKFLDKNLKNIDNDIELKNTKEKYTLVLDGQQRITSLYLTLVGNYIIRNKPQELYFNLLSGEIDDENGNRFEFKFFRKDLQYNTIFYQKDEEKIWIKVKYIVSSKDEYDLEDFIELFINEETDIQLTKLQKRAPKKLYTYIKSHELINYYPETEESLDRVLDIFIRTNAGGTKLSKSDLLFSTIKRNWSGARDAFKNLLVNINKIDKYKFNTDFILKTCLVLFAQNKEDIKYSVDNIDKTLIENIENNWKEISRAIETTIDLVDYSFKLSSSKLISSQNALIPIIYFIYKFHIKTLDAKNIYLIRRWLIKTLLNGIFSAHGDTVLSLAKNEIDTITDKVFPTNTINQSMKKDNRSFFTIEEILDSEKLKYNSANSYLVLSLLYADIQFNMAYSGNLPQQDHIFSQSELKSVHFSKEKINSIFNIQYLDARTNNSKNNMSIDKWLSEVSLEEREQHLIPQGDWTVSTYEEFLLARRKMFIDKLKNIY